jgi:hypothetical protein
VTKEELFATVWPDTAIGDAVLNLFFMCRDENAAGRRPLQH